ncbi:MAG: hypothetical protein AB1742_00215 [bacterium]
MKNRWIRYLFAALVWTGILASLEWLGVTTGQWKYALEIETLGAWSFLVYYPLVIIAGYVMCPVIEAEITRESHWFHDGFITFSLGSIMAMAMQVSRHLNIFGYEKNWNVICCWVLQTSQIILLQCLLGRIYPGKLWRRKSR